MNLSFDGGVTDDGADVVERRPYDAGACPERSRRGACTVLDADGSDDSDNASDVENSASARSGGTSREPTGRVPQGCNGAAGHNPFLFTGRRLDSEWAGMQYRNRSYSTTLGRFVSRDPEGYADSWSLYTYVVGLPTRRSDPLGALAWPDVEPDLESDTPDLQNYLPDVDRLPYRGCQLAGGFRVCASPWYLWPGHVVPSGRDEIATRPVPGTPGLWIETHYACAYWFRYVFSAGIVLDEDGQPVYDDAGQPVHGWHYQLEWQVDEFSVVRPSPLHSWGVDVPITIPLPYDQSVELATPPILRMWAGEAGTKAYTYALKSRSRPPGLTFQEWVMGRQQDPDYPFLTGLPPEEEEASLSDE